MLQSKITIPMENSQLFLILLFSLVTIQFAVQFADGGGSLVTFLPGFEGPLPFELETGYIGVDEGEEVQLFYYFVKSSGSNPEKDPLILWLTGGPGCSVLSGLIFEIGPIRFKDLYQHDGSFPTLILNPYSWTEVANILFLDLPVGTGFSYAKTPEALHSTSMQSCHQAYVFLQKWLVDHPEFISNPFYVGGDSYTGLMVPIIVQMISSGNEMGIKPHIDLKGYLLGNALTFPDEDNYNIPFAHGMGLISNELYQSLEKNCGGKYYENIEPSNLLCLEDFHNFQQLLIGVNGAQIIEPLCPFYSPRPLHLHGERRYLREKLQESYNYEESEKLSAIWCHTDRYRLAPVWANDARVQEALHIQKGSIGTWTRCNSGLPFTTSTWDTTSYHANLSRKGYRSLIYSGDHDMLVTYLSTQAWIKSLNYPVIDEWRQWRVQGQVAGYTRTYANNMTFATVKGGGHVAPEYQPTECAAMFKRWISYQPL